MQVKVIKKIDGKLDRRTGKVITDRLRVRGNETGMYN